MENKKFLVLALLISFIFNFSLMAEENVEEDTPEEWQVLEWEDKNSSYVSSYKVDIEVFNEKAKVFEPLQTVETESNETFVSISPQLKPGMYRYKITSYDLLGFEGAESDWNELKIFQAYEPEIRSISTNANHSSTIYLEEVNDGILTVTGRNLFGLKQSPEDINYTSYYFTPKDGSGKLKSFFPEILEHAASNRELKIQIDLPQIDVGSYNLVAKDASGIESHRSSSSEITIRFKKPVDFDIAAGYVFPVTVFDDTFNKYFNSSMRPISGTAKITFIPMKHTWGYLGIGVQGTYSRIIANFDTYSIDGNMMTAMANLVYQKPVNISYANGTRKRHLLTFEAHGGGGLLFMQDLAFHFAKDVDSRALNTYFPGADVGLGMQVYFTNRIYLELGIDFIYAFMKDMQLGQVLPFVCAGFQL